jgi:hypothetical protein
MRYQGAKPSTSAQSTRPRFQGLPSSSCGRNR